MIDKTEIFNIAAELVDKNAIHHKNKTAIYWGTEKITYGQLLENVNKFVNILADLNISPTERVMIHLPDSPIFFYVFLGSIKYGVWPVPVNTMLNVEDYEYLLSDSKAKVLVTEKESKAAKARINHVCHKLFVDDLLQDYFFKASSEAKVYPSTKQDIAFWLYSSGSTGKPKAVPHRHIDMAHSADNYASSILGLTPEDICFSVSKLFFAYGLGNSLVFPLRYNASVVLLSQPPTPENIIETVKKYKPTVFFGVPTQYNSVLKRIGDYKENPFESVRICVSAGEALPPEILIRWKEKTGIEILDGIGSTEALHIFISNTKGDVKPGTSGKIVPGYEAKVVDEEGNEIPEGEVGYLIIRGESITKGYWNRPEDNKEKFLKDGWFKTGDMYSVKDGYFTYQGRGDDMLKVGGIWVSPVEIENILLQHPSVHEAAVVGQEVESLIKPFGYICLNKEVMDLSDKNAITKEILDFVNEKLPKYKWLRDIYVVNELPKTATGKIQRFKLRKKQNKI